MLLLVQVGVNAVGKRIAVDIGGMKRLHSLVTLFEGICLVPWMLIILATQVGMIFSEDCPYYKNCSLYLIQMRYDCKVMFVTKLYLNSKWTLWTQMISG